MDLKKHWVNARLEAWAYAHDIADRVGRLHAYHKIPQLEREIEIGAEIADNTGLLVGMDKDNDDVKTKLRLDRQALAGYRAKLPEDYSPIHPVFGEVWHAVTHPRETLDEMLVAEHDEEVALQLEAIGLLGQGRSPEDSGAMG
jgi:hypothetical protein